MNEHIPQPVGRFAPSPTGPLHFGSIVAALASYLDARSRDGTWLVRIEDIDTSRCRPVWTTEILRTLEAFGLTWDGEPVHQSSRHDLYEAALAALRTRGLLYACTCSRREIGDFGMPGLEGAVYPGTCRSRGNAEAGAALRVRTDNLPVAFDDRVQGALVQRIESEIGDFVLRRRDVIHAYQLAVVVDDAAQGVTQVVRGADLLDSTPRQIFLQRCLGYAIPDYFHIPVATNESGQKLSKQTFAAGIGRAEARGVLFAALRFLGQDVGEPDAGGTIAELLAAAIRNWRTDAIPRKRAIRAPRILST